MSAAQNKFIDPKGQMAESTLRIQDLAQVEQVSLVQTRPKLKAEANRVFDLETRLTD
jgi:hypothetical protein